MSAVLQDSPGTALTLPQRAAQALVVSKTEAQLAELAKASQSITVITNPAGREQAHAALMVLRSARIEIERAGKDAREDATKFSKAVIQEENRLVAITATEEARLQKLRDDWDDEIAKEKQRRIDAELARVTALNQRIADIRRMADVSALMSSEGVSQVIERLTAIQADESFQELQPQAEDARTAALARLLDAHVNAVARETEAARVKAEREELAKLRAEQEERNRVEQARIVEEARVARIERERVEAEARVAREAEAELNRAAHAAAEEELRLQRESLAAAQAESARIALERQADLDRQAEALRQLQAPPAMPQAAEARMAPPSLDEMMEVLATHYGVPACQVTAWIAAYDWSVAA